MLTTDLVRARRRGGRIEVLGLSAAQRDRLLVAAEHYVALAQAHRGRTRGELEAACDQVAHQPTDYKLIRGIRKLLLDRCTFDGGDEVDTPALRQAVFARAAALRRSLASADSFATQEVLEAAAAERAMSAKDFEAALFADLRENHKLVQFDAISAAALVDRYEMAQKQAVLLRAAGVVVTLRCPDPAGYRLFFRRLKFRRLLYRIQRLGDGRFAIELDGPFSLFQAVTKYGLQLALMLPALDECRGAWELDADIRWGKDRQPVRFHLQGRADRHGGERDIGLPEDVARLYQSFAPLQSPWSVAVADDLLDLPGMGLCVPDLLFTHRDGFRIYLEVMGYWSRDAVWRRVELVRAGLAQPIIFAVSTRLRVSEEVLDGDLPGQLYVYKGVISPAALEARLEAIRQAKPHPAVPATSR